MMQIFNSMVRFFDIIQVRMTASNKRVSITGISIEVMVDPSFFSDIIGDYPIYIQESSLFKIFLAIDSPRINF